VVRAYNVRADLRANQYRLLEYAENGGTLVVQYNVLDYGTVPQALDKIGPYPIKIGRDRVTVEESPVSFPDPASPLLRTANRISEADFDGWVQERGLYFASEWDPKYRTLFESHDPAKRRNQAARCTSPTEREPTCSPPYSWFRQLPAGVPGAFRVFANLLSAGQAGDETSRRRPANADEPPPFLRSWRRVYIGVLLYLAVVVALFYLFTRAFAP